MMVMVLFMALAAVWEQFVRIEKLLHSMLGLFQTLCAFFLVQKLVCSTFLLSYSLSLPLPFLLFLSLPHPCPFPFVVSFANSSNYNFRSFCCLIVASLLTKLITSFLYLRLAMALLSITNSRMNCQIYFHSRFHRWKCTYSV